MPLNLTLTRLASEGKDAEQGCYLKNGDEAAKAGDVAVLQHCVVVGERHRKKWEPKFQYFEIVANHKGEPEARWKQTKGYALKEFSELAEGEPFVDLGNFEGDYYPYFVANGALKAADGHMIRDTQANKSVAVYVLTSAGVLRTFVIYVESRGFGMGDIGAARTDPASEILYGWWGNRAFGYALGLDMAGHNSKAPTKFETKVTVEGHDYHRCSDPGIAHAASSLTVYPTEAEAVIYKRFKGASEGLYASDADVSDSGTKRKKKNRPYQPDGVRLVRLLNETEKLSSAYKTEASKKRKGRNLGESETAEATGGVAEGIPISKSGTGRGTMPKAPTARANGLVQGDKKVRDFLAARGIGLDKGNTLRTDQEWCHLVATSLKGTEKFYNFVLGSRHCNSEQLAIETALLFSLKAVQEANRRLKVKITAYVVPGTELLLGEVIRYKVLMTREDGGDRLLLDHLIDAQSESFSFLEYRVLQETVRRVIAIELGSTHVADYEKRMNERIAERHKADGGGTGLVYKVDEELMDEAYVDDVDDEEEDEDDGEDEDEEDEDMGSRGGENGMDDEDVVPATDGEPGDMTDE